LKLPTKAVSSQTTTFACMKSLTDSGVHGVEVFPANCAPSSTACKSGIFHALTPFVRHWWNTSSTCVSSTIPSTAQRRSRTTSTSVARIGPEVSTGEAMRTRSRAFPTCLAIRCASAAPYSGQNHARTRAPSTSTGRGSTRPEPSTSPLFQSCSKARPYAYAISSEQTVTTTFSCRDQESSVQFVEPAHTA
jgi:hypothetical protein